MPVAKIHIPAEEKYSVIFQHAPEIELYLSGIIASFIFPAVYFIIKVIISLFSAERKIPLTFIEILQALLLFSIIGGISIFLKKLYYKNYNRPFAPLWCKLPILYIFYSIFLLISLVIIISRIPLEVKDNIAKEVLKTGKFYSFHNLLIVYLSVFILSFSLGNLMEYVWEHLQRFIISNITSVDYFTIIEESLFNNELRYRFDEARRYQIPLSLMVIKIKNYDEIIQKVGKRKVKKMQLQVSSVLERNLRHTDFISTFKDGKMRMILTYTPYKSTFAVGERVRDIVEREKFITKGAEKITFKLAFGVGCYTPDMKGPEELLSSANRALEYSLANLY